MRSKKFLVGTIIPALGLASVIGAGFSTFVFGETTVTDESKLAVQLEDYASIGSFSITGSMTLVLDQTPGALSSINPQGKGVYLDVSGLTITYNPTAGHGVKNTDMTFTYTLSMGGLDAVVTEATGSIPWDTAADDNTDTLTWTVVDGDFDIDYVPDKEPINVSSWESLSSMISELADNTPSLTVKAELNIKPIN